MEKGQTDRQIAEGLKMLGERAFIPYTTAGRPIIRDVWRWVNRSDAETRRTGERGRDPHQKDPQTF